MARWTEQNIPDLRGKTALVTGANSGLGLAAAHRLAEHGAQVILAGIGDAETERAMRAITLLTPDASLEYLPLDLGDLDAVHTAADQFRARHKRLDILCNNAGVLGLPYTQTKDGFEAVFGINHLGHFAFTGLLLDAIRATPGARVVTVSSMAHRNGKLPFEDLHWAQRRYSAARAYAQAKLANLVFALELDRRLRRAGIDALSAAAHPGYAATNIFFAGGDGVSSRRRRMWNRFATLGTHTLAQPADLGALPMLHAATADGVQGGEFFGPDGLLEFRGHPQRVKPSRVASGLEIGTELWRISAEMTGVDYLNV